MSIEIKNFDSYIDLNASCVGCSSSCVDVVLISDNVRIPLCEDCLKQLRNDIDEKINKMNCFCRHCAYFTPDKYEPSKHDGKCQLQPNVMCDSRNSCNKFIKKYPIKRNIDELTDSNDYHLNPLGEKNV